MNRSIILAAIIISAAVLLNGQLERISRASHFTAPPEKPNYTFDDKSIAILPFQILSEDPQDSNFADGVREEIISRLAKVHQLKVIGPSVVKQQEAASTASSREIGRDLGVAYLLQGSTQRAGNRVRVHARLIDAGQDKTVWMETYDRDLTDLFALETEIAQKIADGISTELTAAKKLALAERRGSQ